jgi:spermidine/putrescine transport system ATP-binding protein/putrescine transport system ATP-binding protein
MFQSYALFPHMSVERNVAYGLEQERMPKDEIRTRVGEVLATVGLSDKAAARPSELSGGQRQRVALARAIVKRPRLLLLDEPLSALDRQVRGEMQIELKRLQHEFGITFVVVTHDQEEAMSMADRIAVMHEGRVQQVDSPIALYTNPANVFVASFIGTSTMLAGQAMDQGLLLADGTVLPASDPGSVRGSAVLMLRPEDIEPVASGAGLLDGEVVETHFFGGSSLTRVRVAGVGGLVTLAQQGASPFGMGDRIGLRWSVERAVLLPAD